MKCPNCQRRIDGTSAIDGSSSLPQLGDVSVCLGCEHVSIFTDLGLRSIEESEITNDVKIDIAHAITIVKLYKMIRAVNQHIDGSLIYGRAIAVQLQTPEVKT
jgi:hypothetical protein